MCCIHKYWDGSVVTEGIWFCKTRIHVSTFTGGKKLVESKGACPIVHVREPDYQLCMFPSRWRCPLGESQFCTHASFPEIWGCLYKNTCLPLNSKLSRPLEIKLSRPISYFSEKLYHTYEKSKTDVFQWPWRRQFTEWDSEEKFWSQVFGETQEAKYLIQFFNTTLSSAGCKIILNNPIFNRPNSEPNIPDNIDWQKFIRRFFQWFVSFVSCFSVS